MKASLQYQVTKKGVVTEQILPGGFAAKTNNVADIQFFEKVTEVRDNGTEPRKVVRLMKKVTRLPQSKNP